MNALTQADCHAAHEFWKSSELTHTHLQLLLQLLCKVSRQLGNTRAAWDGKALGKCVRSCVCPCCLHVRSQQTPGQGCLFCGDKAAEHPATITETPRGCHMGTHS